MLRAGLPRPARADVCLNASTGRGGWGALVRRRERRYAVCTLEGTWNWVTTNP